MKILEYKEHLTIERPKNLKTYCIYIEGELSPLVNKKFRTSDEAMDYIENNMEFDEISVEILN